MLSQCTVVATITVPSQVLQYSMLFTLLSQSICCDDTVQAIPPHSAALLHRNLRLHLAIIPVYSSLLLTEAINGREGKQAYVIGCLTASSAAFVNECHPGVDCSQQAPLQSSCEDDEALVGWHFSLQKSPFQSCKKSLALHSSCSCFLTVHHSSWTGENKSVLTSPVELKVQAVTEDMQESSHHLGLPGFDKPFPLLAENKSPCMDTVQSKLNCLL